MTYRSYGRLNYHTQTLPRKSDQNLYHFFLVKLEKFIFVLII